MQQIPKSAQRMHSKVGSELILREAWELTLRGQWPLKVRPKASQECQLILRLERVSLQKYCSRLTGKAVKAKQETWALSANWKL